jgi:hypothetical protein
MEQFRDQREAARSAVESLGATAVMAEDFPAALTSPRNACMDGVDSADVCVVIVGARGGWTAPSGKLVVEEEYEEALRRNLLISVYIEETPRDADAERLAKRLSDYVSGHFRATFQRPSDLREVMMRHLPAVLKPLRLPMTDPKELADRLTKPYAVQYQTTARLVVAPERDEEVIDRVTIGSATFLDSVLAIGHTAGSKLFDYRASKENELKGDVLIIEESASGRRRHSEPSTRVEITPEAVVTVDRVVSPGETDDPLDSTGTFFLVRRDVELALATMFTFVGQLFDSIDRFQRHQRFTYGVSFAGIGFRSLVDQVEKRSSYSMASNIDGAVVIEKPRNIARNVLNQPRDEVARIITLLGRRINESSAW